MCECEVCEVRSVSVRSVYVCVCVGGLDVNLLDLPPIFI